MHVQVVVQAPGVAFCWMERVRRVRCRSVRWARLNPCSGFLQGWMYFLLRKTNYRASKKSADWRAAWSIFLRGCRQDVGTGGQWWCFGRLGEVRTFRKRFSTARLRTPWAQGRWSKPAALRAWQPSSAMLQPAWSTFAIRGKKHQMKNGMKMKKR